MFSCTPIGMKIDGSMNNSSTPSQFILNRQNYHHIESLLSDRSNRVCTIEYMIRKWNQ